MVPVNILLFWELLWQAVSPSVLVTFYGVLGQLSKETQSFPDSAQEGGETFYLVQGPVYV